MSNFKLINKDDTCYICIDNNQNIFAVQDHTIAYEQLNSSEVNVYVKEKQLYKFIGIFNYNMLKKAIEDFKSENDYINIYLQKIK